MYIDGHNVCIGCMRSLAFGESCSFCGLKQEEYVPVPRYLAPGTKLANRYVTGKVLGEGGFGITYIGWDQAMCMPVAIKEYFPGDMVSRDVICGSDNSVYLYANEKESDYKNQLKKFLNEAKCLSHFNQVEGIVSVRDFFYENNTAYLVMQYIEGDSVKEYIWEHGQMDAAEVLDRMRPVLLALEQVHGTGIIHRDISPDNLILDRDGNIILIDFGAARMRNVDRTRTMTVMFKRGFSPEEQYRLKGRWGPYTDVYAICATMYYMMTAKIPEDSVTRVLDDKLSLSSFRHLNLTDRQRKALLKGMAVSGEKRFQSIGALCSALYEEEADDGRGLPWRWRGAGLKKRFAAAAAVFSVVTGVVMGFRFFQTDMVSPVTGSRQMADSRRMTAGRWAVVATEPAITGPAAVRKTPAPVKRVKVPDLKGMTVSAAKKKLQKLHLKYRVKKISSGEKKGTVIRQSIKPGRYVVYAAKVILTASKGSPLVQTTPRPTAAPASKKNDDRKPGHDKTGDFVGVIQ